MKSKKKKIKVPEEFAVWLTQTTNKINSDTGFDFKPFEILKMMFRKIKIWGTKWIWHR